MASEAASPNSQRQYVSNSGATTPTVASQQEYSANPAGAHSPPVLETPLGFSKNTRAQSMGQLSRMSAVTTRSLYSDYHQHRVHKTLNQTKLGPGRIPFRNGVICVTIASFFCVAGIVLLFVYKFHRLTGMSDKEEFIPILCLAIGVAAYGISIWFFYEARKKSNAFRSKLRFKPRPATSEAVSVVNIAYEPEKTDLESLRTGSVTDRAVTNLSYNPSYASNTLSSRAAYAGGGSVIPAYPGRWSTQPPVRSGMSYSGSAGSMGGYNQNRAGTNTPSGAGNNPANRTQVYAYHNMGYKNEMEGLASGSSGGALMATNTSRPPSMNSQVSYNNQPMPENMPVSTGVHPVVAASFAAQNRIPPESQSKDTAL